MSKGAKTISVIGDGGWGTTLAALLAEKGFPTTLWGAFADNVNETRRLRENRKFLAGIKLPKTLSLTADLRIAIEGADIIVMAVPSQFLESVLRQIKKMSYQKKTFVSVVKGIDTSTFLTMSQLIQGQLGKIPVVVLSGPTIAIEVAKKIPTTAVAACKDLRLAREIQDIFSCEYFRIYTNTDVMGVELCGSVKNVIALACGVCDGLGLGTNTKSAILTRGLVEMSRLGRAMKARPETFAGLAGLGDLATTCFSLNSRNRFVGSEIGKGRSVKTVLGSMNAVAEGVVTAKAVYRLSRKLNIDMPITRVVYEILYKGKSPKNAVRGLMTRSLKQE